MAGAGNPVVLGRDERGRPRSYSWRKAIGSEAVIHEKNGNFLFSFGVPERGTGQRAAVPAREVAGDGCVPGQGAFGKGPLHWPRETCEPNSSASVHLALRMAATGARARAG